MHVDSKDTILFLHLIMQVVLDCFPCLSDLRGLCEWIVEYLRCILFTFFLSTACGKHYSLHNSVSSPALKLKMKTTYNDMSEQCFMPQKKKRWTNPKQRLMVHTDELWVWNFPVLMWAHLNNICTCCEINCGIIVWKLHSASVCLKRSVFFYIY